jgi:hypothetical protein
MNTTEIFTVTDGITLQEGCLLIDNSSLERITTCQRSAYYYLCAKRETSKERPALDFGKLVHRILEHKAKNSHLPLPDLINELRSFATLIFEKGEYTASPEDFRNFDFTMRLIDAYCTTYPVDAQIYELPNGLPALEIPFAVPLGTFEGPNGVTLRVKHSDGSSTLEPFKSLPVIWTGRIDRIIQQPAGIYLLDHKTTSIMGPTFFRDFELSSQFMGYTYAAQQLLGKTITGCVIDAIGIRQPTKTGKAIELQRHIVSYTPEQIAEWTNDTMLALQTFLNNLTNGYVPKATKWCFGKYGACQYIDVCTLPANQRATMLSTADYKPVTWSPLT